VQSGRNRNLQGGNFRFIDRHGNFSDPYQMHDPGDGKDREPILRIKPTEDVSREKRQLDVF
jgi:hypothetical protein